MAIKSFRDLRVWQAGMDLVEAIYRITQPFPAHEQYGLTSQMRRAACSIPSNIAEGHTRQYTKEYLYHLSVAQASLAELETQLEISARLGYLLLESKESALNQTVSLQASLNSGDRDSEEICRPLTPTPWPL